MQARDTVDNVSVMPEDSMRAKIVQKAPRTSASQVSGLLIRHLFRFSG